MKVLLLDESLEFLAERLSGFNVLTARRMGLDGRGMAHVMRECRDMKFDALVTTDRTVRFPAGSEGWTFGFVVLDILPATEEGYLENVDRIRSAVLGAKPGVVSTVRWPR